ncbi:hypothetical protein BDV93DRAFT_520623 [Ceratobasidium sp. AG-I]|nr:hypothetical protein BDV93DRAFT_520623 [Ceratobasidium sp. AG-I]
MPRPSTYSLLPASPDLTEASDDLFELEESWSPQRSTSHNWLSRAGPFGWATGRPSRLPRVLVHRYIVAVTAISTVCVLAVATVLFDRSFLSQWVAGKEPSIRDCFELHAEELVWQTTQLPSEQSPQCPFDPETFTILGDPANNKHSDSASVRWSNECLEAMLANGQVNPRSCDTVRANIDRQNVDLVWTWVNGSSVLLELIRRERVAEVSGLSNIDTETEAPAGLAAKLFRDHDELRHSIRAALKHFRHDTTNFFLVASDLPVGVKGLEDGGAVVEARVGQLPSWLALEDVGVDGEFVNWGREGKQTQLHITNHRDIFSHYEGTVFSSLAIESQFSNLGRIGVSDIFVYINDDVFFSRDLSARDFYMAEHGIVMRMQNYITISPDPEVPQHDGLEWESLQYSNWLLSNRFGTRHRPYPTHLAKTLSIPMLQEVSQAWSEETLLVESRPFRGMKHMDWFGTGESHITGGSADMYMVFLEHHWVVERWREALLWSWVVGRGQHRAANHHESNADAWTKSIAREAWKELGGSADKSVLEVRRARRGTLDKANEWAGTQATTLTFSSLDGYPYSEGMGETGWVSEGDVCEINFDHCFNNHDSASRTFQRVAFEEPTACGDCIIRALINKSGERGLEAFLPPASSESSRTWQGGAAKLPVSARWQDTNFQLSSVLGSKNIEQADVKTFVLQMLQRYRFVLGETPFLFAIVTDPQSAERDTQRIDQDESLAIVCVNDNVAEGDDRVREILGQWMGSRWNQSASWERDQ